ncbi:MAG: zinc-binding dehydrogenase [Pirellulaceae bacterium]|nr:zinc-binding dehydrogenase [Pirellulaceae bacterium]
MTTAIAAVLEEVGRPLVLREFPLPVPRAGETLVEVIACTLCGSDLHSLHGRRPVPLPTILGHEILGRVSAFGPGTNGRDAAGQPLAVGDRVTWSIVASCGDCFYCRRDLPQKCLHQTKYGHEPLRPGRELTGGLADHCLLAAGTAIFRVPPNISNAAACPANCATATIAAALEAAGPLAGNRVLVMGAGMLGVTAAAWTRALGAADVVCCDVAAERLALAARFGATRTCSTAELPSAVAELAAGHGVDVAFELTGSPEAFEAALPQVRIGGTMILVGSVFPSRPVPLLLEQVVRRCLTLRGIHNYAPRHLAAALAFLDENREYPFETLVAPWQPLSAINAAIATPLSPPALRSGIALP